MLVDDPAPLVEFVARHRAILRAALDELDDAAAAARLATLLHDFEQARGPAPALPASPSARPVALETPLVEHAPTRRSAGEGLARLREAVSNLADGVMLGDLTFGPLEWNDAAARIHGFADAEDARRRQPSVPFEFELVDDAGRVLPIEEGPPSRLRRGEPVRGWVLTLRHKPSGRERVIRHDGAVVADPTSGERLLLLFLHDLTEAGTLRRERDETSALLRSIADGTTDTIFAKDLSGRYTFANAAAARLIGRAPSDIVGKRDEDLFDARSASDFHAHDLAVFRSGEPSTCEERVTIAGEPRVFSVTRSTLRDACGTVIGLIGIAHDITDRLAAEERERAGHRVLRTLIDHAQAIIWVKDLDGRFRLVNRRCAQALGRTEAEIVGRSAHDLFGDHGARYEDNDRRVLAAGTAQSFEETVVLDGVERTLLSINFPLRGADGSIEALGAICTDITRRIEAARKLEESEQLYHRLVDVLPSAVYLNRAGRIAVCNAAMVELLGASSYADLVGRRVLDLYPNRFHATIEARIAEMMETGRAVAPHEYQIRRVDGRLVPVSVVATPTGDRDGRTVLVVVRDLTEREQSLELLRAIMDSVTDTIITIDPSGTIRAVNPSVEPMFGYTPQELLGRPLDTLIPEPHRGRSNEFLARVNEDGCSDLLARSHDVPARRRDGTEFAAELFVTAFSWNGRRHFTGVVRDVTQRKLLESEFHHAQKMEAVGRLAGGVAHDFNNLLTVILGYCELLDPRATPKEIDRSRGVIRVACERAARLTGQLLAYSRKAILAPRVVDLQEVVREAEQLLRRLIGEDVRVHVECASTACFIRADVGQLEQVLLNLAVNSRDAMPRGGALRVATRRVDVTEGGWPHDRSVPVGRYVELEFTDTGCGIDADALPRIFEPFFTTKRVGEGTGLGLTVVHGVMQQTGGFISVQSTVGTGTTFRLLFPELPEPSHTASEHEHSDRLTGKESILVVEDEPEVRRVVVRALESRGYRVVDVGSPRDALKLSSSVSREFDLLITDVVMPGIDGPELAEQLKRINPRLRVVYVSGYTDDAVLRHGIDTASVLFLQKPFTRTALAKQVRMALDGG
ncbi:MAG: PAS domain S-box protein [Planctomycetes bacterium]|nr:PAS domain S-box protein [Planctomycetota bacterium]